MTPLVEFTAKALGLKVLMNAGGQFHGERSASYGMH
jgi:hypothetical protein